MSVKMDCTKTLLLLSQVLGVHGRTRLNAVREYESAFAGWLGARHAFSFWKGRVALYAILKALGVGEGDSVILPGYTCVVVPAAVSYLGAKCSYVDIVPDTYNIDPSRLDAALDKKTKALVIQHTYGIPAAVDELLDWASKHGLPVIEDCCHSLGSTLMGKKLGTFGVASFFSSQWNKPYTTGLGGLVATNDESLAARIRTFQEDECVSPSRAEERLLMLQCLAHHWFFFPKTAGLVTGLYRALSSKLLIGSSCPLDLTPEMPENYSKLMSPGQAVLGLREVEALDDNVSHRKQIAQVYRKTLEDVGWRQPHLPKGAEVAFVRYPVRVGNKDELLKRAPWRLIELGDWFDCPIHPKKANPALFGYTRGMCPQAEKASREVINLPTHRKVSKASARRTVRWVLHHASPARPWRTS